MTPERVERLRSVLRRRQADLTIVTDHVHKGRNLSAIVRTADAVGIGHVHCVIKDDDYRHFLGTAKGSHQWVKVHRHANISDALLPLKEQGLQIVAADVGDNVCHYREVDYTKPTVLLMGAEKFGVSAFGRQWVDQFITVPMVGMVESFNVSTAAGIILTEAQTQRDKAGMYDEQSISQEEFDRTFFEWGHPVIRDYCLKHNLDYPALNEDGEIDNPSQWYASVKA